MATRKCGNIYFPKYFTAVRPFLTRIFFKNYLGWRGKTNFLEIFRQVHNLKILNRLLRSKRFFQKNIPGFYMQRMCTLFGYLACDHGRHSRQLDQYGC